MNNTKKINTNKINKLKPHIKESIRRLEKFIDLNAPATIVGAEAFNLLSTVFAAYGVEAGWVLIEHIRDQNLHRRGICGNDDCTNYVDRPNVGLCANCLKDLDLYEDETKYDKQD